MPLHCVVETKPASASISTALKRAEQVSTLEETSDKISLVLAILSCRTVEIKGFGTEAAGKVLVGSEGGVGRHYHDSF